MKTKTLISFAVTTKLICVFVFACAYTYAKSPFSHNEAHFIAASVNTFHYCRFYKKAFISADSINTKKTLEHLRDLISQCNIYVSEVKTKHRPNRILLQNIGDYIVQMFKVSLDTITQTCPCNIQQYFTPIKILIFRRKIMIFFLFLLKTLIVGRH